MRAIRVGIADLVCVIIIREGTLSCGELGHKYGGHANNCDAHADKFVGSDHTTGGYGGNWIVSSSSRWA